DGGRGCVGVDVQLAALLIEGDGRNDGDGRAAAGRGENVTVDGDDFADAAEIDRRPIRAGQSRPLADQDILRAEVEGDGAAAESTDLFDERFADIVGQHAGDDFEGTVVGIAPALDKLRLNS